MLKKNAIKKAHITRADSEKRPNSSNKNIEYLYNYFGREPVPPESNEPPRCKSVLAAVIAS